MDGFQVELFGRLPLAQAALKIFDHVFDAGALNGLFEEHRGRCYQRALTFDTLVRLVRDALVLHGGSGRRSFEAADEADALPVAHQNAYAKLGRLPPAVSMALLAHGSRRMEALLPAGPAAVDLPASLARLEVVAFDGKKIKNAAKRLGALRGLPGKLLGGKLLVALSLRSGLALAMEADPDGERNDVPLVPGLVEQVRGRVAHAVLWMGDRQFGCSLDLPALLCGRAGDHFLLRCGKSPHFHADPHRPAQEGRDAAGRRFVQEWGRVGGPEDPRRRYVRRVTLYRPGEGEDVTLVTGLVDGAAYPAQDLLAVYLQRWGIERMFQQVTEVFDLRKLIGSTPAAMVFQSAVCFVLYDVVQVLRAHAAADGGRAREEVSTEKLFGDARDQLKTWADLGDCALTGALLPAVDDSAAVAAWLANRMAGTWRDRWTKAPPKKRRPAGTPAKVPKRHGGHTSVWRVLRDAKVQSGSRRGP